MGKGKQDYYPEKEKVRSHWEQTCVDDVIFQSESKGKHKGKFFCYDVHTTTFSWLLMDGVKTYKMIFRG